MQDATNALVRKLQQYDEVSEDEIAVLRNAIDREVDVPENRDLVSEGSRPSLCTLVIEGFCGRYKLLPNGKRQFTAIHIPGDFVDLHSFLVKKMDHAVLTLTPCRVAQVSHDSIGEITQDYPHLTRLLWLSTLTDAAIHREWVVALGARDAMSHLAHFICEMYVRLAAAGLTDSYRAQIPTTQQELGDTLGLSPVHINRTLQELRSLGLITWTRQDVEILNWNKLQELAMFDPTYLSIEREPR